MSEAPPLASTELARVIADGVSEAPLSGEPNPLWQQVSATGTDLWLDTGDMDQAAALWNPDFQALTTNNTLLNMEIQKGIYDSWIPVAAAAVRADDPEISEQDLVLEIAFALNARHGLRLVERFGARVSVELHTDLAHDVERSLAYGRRYAALCDRFIVKVPLTPSGLVAARHLEEEGIPVNFTLGFSARENYLIACVARPHWVNVFLGRLHAYAAGEGLCDGRWVGERTTMARPSRDWMSTPCRWPWPRPIWKPLRRAWSIAPVRITVPLGRRKSPRGSKAWKTSGRSPGNSAPCATAWRKCLPAT
ncbi:MAG: transaldolase family protein [Planctomycetota bacterium]|jgi:transaldolase